MFSKRSRRPRVLELLDTEDEGVRILQNFGKYLPVDMV
jgi:hypothetical protein